ncbi:uncharacterized protein LOC100679353 isoform X2 [Nasonia vitripennis]|uniref:Uncharacterized protein n=1 Tax=Nasonia vitripennis TaxID=7425 RepID=A0A7M7QB56_NASVI|nr:uncharacterized protein LOC100679353 isoform X2 [Nasonia vitripennis]
MVVTKKNSCRICLKVFCCADCRDKHENSKHPKPKCSLCVRQALPFGVASEEDSLKKSELLCHLVFNHLPLRCKLCGDRFRKNQDFLEAEPCRWWNERRRKDSKTGVKNDEGVAAARDAERKLPLTPQIQPSSEANKSLRSIDTSSIIRLKQENFDSPPELARHTSTPVHHPAVALPGQKLQSGVGGVIPQFSLKTPCSFDRRYSSSATSSSSTFESRYYTGLSQLLSAGKNSNELDRVNQSEVEPTWNSPTYSILKKLEPLNVMKPEGLDSTEKRVRFSDQCPVPTSTAAAAPETSAYFADNEIFFEARESLEDDQPDSNNNDEKDLASKTEEKSQPSGACACCHHQASNSSLETSANKSSSSSSSSRVVMMLLLEKTDSSKSLSSLDLAPLIDSGLKKLEESDTSKLCEELSEKGRKVKSFIEEHSLFGCASEKPIDRRQESKIEEVSLNDVSSSSSSGSHGIFSAMARVVRSALKRLPAVGSAASTSSRASHCLSREPLPQGACPAASSVTSASSLSIASTAEVLEIGSSRSTTSASQIILQRSASKRPRDRIDSGEEPQSQPPPRDWPGNSGGSPRQEVVSSPAAKRHRGWYRIRAREPIARMRERQLVPQSPRGACRETQRFQQGSLTIGDNTFLPLPSRAHQSTQTED